MTILHVWQELMPENILSPALIGENLIFFSEYDYVHVEDTVTFIVLVKINSIQ